MSPYHARGNILRESLALYAFSWQFDGNCGYVQGGECIYKVCEDGVEVVEWGKCESLEKLINLDLDLDEFYDDAKDDPLIGCVARRYRGLRPRRTGVKGAILIGVAQQNASFRQGWGMIYKIHKLASKRVKAFSREYLLTPEEVTEEQLKMAGFGYRSNAVLEAFKLSLDCSNLERLKEVKGIGNYTLALVRIFACGDFSQLPLDKWIKALAERAYGDWRELNRYGKYKGLAALLITVALDAVPLRNALKRLEEGKVCPYEEPSPLTLWKYY